MSPFSGNGPMQRAYGIKGLPEAPRKMVDLRQTSEKRMNQAATASSLAL